MNRNTLLIIGGAFFMAALVAIVVQMKLGGSDGKPSSLTEVLVANKRLMIGEKIQPKDVRWQVWPKDGLFKGMILREDQDEEEEDLPVYDTPLRRNIESGEPVTTHAVIADVKGGNNFLAASIEPGMRAVAVSVKAETSVGGFLAPGDYVDVIVAYAPRLDTELKEFANDIIQRNASQTILSNVRVLAVDQNAKEQDREAKAAKTVTLEVTKDGAEKIALGEAMGDISLALRRMGEQDTDQDKALTITTDASVSSVIRKVREVKTRKEGSSNTVRVYSGTEIQNVPVRNSIEMTGEQAP